MTALYIAIGAFLALFTLEALARWDAKRAFPTWAMTHDPKYPKCKCVGWARKVDDEVREFVTKNRFELSHHPNCDGHGSTR